jgi:apolipoprotein N-acyltransferase
VADGAGAVAAPDAGKTPRPPTSRPGSRVARLGLAAAAGAALSAAFAPLGLWPLAVLAPAVLIALWSDARDAREGAALGFAFSFGTYAAGTWWLYIAIHVFGQAPLWIAAAVMVALVAIMAGYQALLGYVVLRFLPVRTVAGQLAAVPAAWVLLEWWRGWFLSGFPWLSLGYSQTDTWLAGLAPLGGVHLLSAALLVCAGALVVLVRAAPPLKLVAAVLLVLPWTLGAGLRDTEWTRASGVPVSVAILQGAVSQDLKWLESNRQEILDDYAKLHREALGARLIVWPESALPDLANSLPRYLSGVWSSARRAGSDVLLGVMRFDPARTCTTTRCWRSPATSPRSTTSSTSCRSASTSRCRRSCATGCG